MRMQWVLAIALWGCGNGKAVETRKQPEKAVDVQAASPEQRDAAPPDASISEGDCEGAVDHMAALQHDTLAAVPQKDRAHYEERITKMREAMLHACHETKWSAAMTTCMKNMKSLDDGDECEKMETQEQSDFAEKALQATQGSGAK